MSSIVGFSLLHGWLWLKSFPNVPLQSMHQFNAQVIRNIMMIVLEIIDPFFLTFMLGTLKSIVQCPRVPGFYLQTCVFQHPGTLTAGQ
jgi:hypothetical protein